MATLMSLPMELLCKILEEVGGSHLRRGKGTARLALCRRWYSAAHAVFHSGLAATEIRLYGHNLNELDSKLGPSGQRPLMHKNTRKLRLRLAGHYWDENSARAYEDRIKKADLHGFLTRPNQRPFDFRLPQNMQTLEEWRDQELKPRLDDVFDDMRHFSALEDLVVEAHSDFFQDHSIAPHWDYLHQSSVLHLLHSLPLIQDLSSLTLDICGLSTGFLNEKPNVHLCHSLARVIPHIEHVRLRMPFLCADLLHPPQGEDVLERPDIRLKTLVIKLHLPYTGGRSGTTTQICSATSQTTGHLCRDLALTTPSFLEKLSSLRRGPTASSSPQASPLSSSSHGVTLFRISYNQPPNLSINTLDLLTMKMLFLGEEFFFYEDDGSPDWFELEPRRLYTSGGSRL